MELWMRVGREETEKGDKKDRPGQVEVRQKDRHMETVSKTHRQICIKSRTERGTARRTDKGRVMSSQRHNISPST